MALLIAAPLAIAIALFLSELAPRGVRGVIGPLVEMLAAIPSVVLGLWGILVLGPFVRRPHRAVAARRALGFIPLFGGDPEPSGIFIAGLILAIMVVPIVASICRELFLAVPHELEEGALALGATRWEMVRGVVLSSSRPGIAAAIILGLGRALGEAIAVTQVIGGGDRDPRLAVRARRHARQPDRGPVPAAPSTKLQSSSLVLPGGDPARDRARRRTCSRS